jgi:imidazolonepropionase-like amidohydrolase
VTEIHKTAVARAISAGVKVAMGTDSGITEHGQNLRELGLMVGAGMSPLDSMLATTRSAADLLGVGDTLGTIEPGKRADLTIVDGDPFDYADLSDRVAAVYQDGRLVAGAVA